MSLATRCSACGTVFRVVQDQLKVSEGWVRCGRCNEVFNALESLFDLDHELPPAWPAAAPDDGVFDPTVAPPPVDLDPTGTQDSLVDRIDAQVFGAHPFGAQTFGSREAQAEAAAQAAIAVAAVPRPLPVTTRSADPPADEPAPAPEAPPAAAPAEAAEPTVTPPLDFIRQADRQARLRDPRARAVLGAATVILIALLGAQAAHQFRDVLAARWPSARPLLAAWCARAGCVLQAPRRIDEISVDSSSLARVAGPDSFRLSVTLRNRGTLALALPDIDLSLTDVAGQLVARRALTPQDFRAPSPLIAPGSEAPLQLLLSAGSPKVTGYTIEIFYP